MPSKKSKLNAAPHFRTTSRSEIPNGRKGKHHQIVNDILDDLQSLGDGRSLKIPLTELSDTKVNVRSALNRATRKLHKSVATAADDTYLYVWNSDIKD